MSFSAALLWWILARDGEAPSSEETLELEGVFRSLLRVRTVRILMVMALLLRRPH